MGTFDHGGDWYAAQSVYTGPLLDCSANLNPLGMPPAVRTAAEQAVEAAGRYPDPHCTELCAGIAARDGVAPDWVLCGAGAADLLYRLAFAVRPRRAVVTAPTFSEYEAALRAVGCAVERHRLAEERSFDLEEDFLERLVPGVDLVVLCTPNNPTGRLIHPPLLQRIGTLCARRGILLLVDQCFLSLSCGPEEDLTDRLEDWPNLLLLRAFTKSYGIPGLRLGYCLCADRGLLERMEAAGPPWSVSTPAQAAGLAALACPDWPARARELLAVERPRLLAGLTALGLEVVPGQANYLLFRAPGRTDLKERLLQRGVLLRACGNYPGLGGEYYRTCVGTEADNGRLLAALKEVL